MTSGARPSAQQCSETGQENEPRPKPTSKSTPFRFAASTAGSTPPALPLSALVSMMVVSNGWMQCVYMSPARSRPGQSASGIELQLWWVMSGTPADFAAACAASKTARSLEPSAEIACRRRAGHSARGLGGVGRCADLGEQGLDADDHVAVALDALHGSLGVHMCHRLVAAALRTQVYRSACCIPG